MGCERFLAAPIVDIGPLPLPKDQSLTCHDQLLIGEPSTYYSLV
jgi:hypothetical protein